MKLGDLHGTIGTLIDESAVDVDINHITHDSRKVQHGSIFVALPGLVRDGHEYIACASQLGAVAVVTQFPEKVPCCIPTLKVDEPRKAMARIARQLYGYPDKKLKIVGITGTNGKTTCTYLTNYLLRPQGMGGRIGTLSYYNGVSEERATRTTPESTDLYRSLAEMVANGCKYASMEISSHGLAYGRVLDLELHYAIFTNLSRDHLDFHSDMEDYFQAKQKIFSHLVEGGTAIINWDHPYGRRLTIPKHARIIRYGTDHEAEIRYEITKLDPAGCTFRLSYDGKEYQVRLPMMGQHNVSNFCASVAVSLCEGQKMEDLIEAARGIAAVPGRTEAIELGQDFSVIIDFAHTPDALQNVLRACREVTQGRLMIVFGAGGDRDTTKRPEMGAAAEAYADFIYLTSDNPRTENPETIMDMIQAGIDRPVGDHFRRNWDRRQAIRECIDMAQAGDTILIAGKGHETAQDIGGRMRPFDDRQIASQYIQARLG